MVVMLVADEIDRARTSLSLPEGEFRRLPDPQARVIYSDLLVTFVDGDNRRWWWDAFKQKSTAVQFNDDKGFNRIPSIVPDSKEIVWFIAEDGMNAFYPVYEGTPEAITKVLGECYAFEYYIVPKSKQWLLCENHHGYVIGVGNVIEERLAKAIA